MAKSPSTVGKASEAPKKSPSPAPGEIISNSFAGPQAEGGETHQFAGGDVAILTTAHGIPVADDQNSLKLGARGPILLEDSHFREKMFHFDHERIPERVVHARGYGAHGYFELTESLSDVTRTDVLQRVGGLGLPLPDPAQAARPTMMDLSPSDALSILKNGPDSFKGRKLGILMTDGADAAIFNALVKAVEKEGAVYEVVAPKIGGVTLSDGTAVAAKQKIDGGPSVLFDAVAVVASEEGAALLAIDAAAKDFVTDAFAHCKYIGLTAEAQALFEKAGIADDLDEACLPLATVKDAGAFIAACRALRHWPRELAVDPDAQPAA